MGNRISPRSQHYFYVHDLLRNYFLGPIPYRYYDYPQRAKDGVLRDFWFKAYKYYAEKGEPKIQPEGLGSTTESLGDNKILIIIKLPEPVATTEAYYVGVYYHLKEDGRKVRYFTYEFDASKEVFFCEWVIQYEAYDTNVKHILRGITKDSSLNSFIDLIKQELNLSSEK